VLKTIVDNNKDKISFQFGEYENTTRPVALDLHADDRPGRTVRLHDRRSTSRLGDQRDGNGASQGGLTRDGLDDATIGAKTYYYIKHGKLFNGETSTSRTARAARRRQLRRAAHRSRRPRRWRDPPARCGRTDGARSSPRSGPT
jgi:hypothetical protein